MDEKFEQCSEKNSTEKVSDLSVSNQETPEDYKNKVARTTEARKLGQTPSSLDLPKISLDEFSKWDALLCLNKPPEGDTQQKQGADKDVCSEQANQSVENNSSCGEGEQKPGDDVHADETPVSTETDDKGRVVREKYASGPDVVVAYDEKGEPHKFINEPIKEMPPSFKDVPEWRDKQLDKEAQAELDKYMNKTRNYMEPSGVMDYEKVADMQKEIAARQDLTETEKCLLYSKIQTTMRETPIKVENWNAKRETIDSWTGESDPWHAVAPIDDRYHNRLVNMSPEESSKAIQEQEDYKEGDMHSSPITGAAWKVARWWYGVNTGDINASEGQVKCMRELKEKGTFSAYAEEWDKQFVDRSRLNPRGGASGVV